MKWEDIFNCNGELGKIYRMPEEVAMGRDEEESLGLRPFMGISNEDAFETKNITVSNVGKIYERLEIHDLSPQMYTVLRGKVEIPAAQSLDGEKVTYIVNEGEAIILSPKVWHGGASGVDVPATVFIVLKEGTTQHDTKKVSLPFSFKLGSC